MKGVADYGLVAHWADLDDARRWRLALHTQGQAAPPTGPTVARACRWPNFTMHMNAPWQDVRAGRWQSHHQGGGPGSGGMISPWPPLAIG